MAILRWSLLSLSVFVALIAMGQAAAAPAPAPAPPAKEATPATPAAAPAAAPAAIVDQDAANLWRDFNHYVRIARPDLAQAAATALLGKASESQLLDVVETSEYREDYEQTLIRAGKIEALKATAEQLTAKIAAARIARAREPQRIMADIQHLAEGSRANENATQRLVAAGQFAAPHLLRTLCADDQKKLHPFVMAAMVAIGRPMVYPLSTALPALEPRPQTQVAQVLAEIGYPRAIPYLKQVIEDTKTDPNARAIVQTAYDQIARATRLPANITAAELFLTLGQNLYTAASTPLELPGYDPASKSGIVWEYTRETGLIARPVPAALFGDILTMRAARTTLALSPQMDPALSLWLMANLRRENHVAAGQTDDSYPKDLQSPSYYLMMAGPLRQHDVLHRALEDNDAALALKAVMALAGTAGTDALVNRTGTAQPLVEALSYPDRRVRFAAAFAMTNARPQTPFPASFRVVPVLAEAVRQTESKNALVIGSDPNALAAALKELGYQTAAGKNLQDVANQVAGTSGVDLIVASLDADGVQGVYDQVQRDYRLKAAPVLAAVGKRDAIELNRRYAEQKRRPTVIELPEDAKQLGATLKPAVEDVVKSMTGTPMSADEAAKYAGTALKLLREIALSRGQVFKVSDAQPALIQALKDARPEIVKAAAAVLSLLNDPDAQRTLADAALDAARPEDQRIALLGCLAESANYYGNKLAPAQLDKVLTLVKGSTGELGLAAARAHGALTLPTSNVVQLIVK